MLDRGLRWLLKWYLSGALGPVGLGAYETASRLAQAITSFSPLGLDTGIILFAARYRKSGELGRLKAALISGALISGGLGLLSGAGLYLGAPWLSEEPLQVSAFRLAAPVVALWTPLLYCVGLLKAAKDQRGSTLAYQVALPLVMGLSSAVAVGLLGGGLQGAMLGLLLGTLASLLWALRLAWRRWGQVMVDRSIAPAWETGALLRFSIPQSLTAAAFQLTLGLDALMLASMGSLHEAGLYAVASSLAAFGNVPANAIATVLNPFIAELAYVDDRERLSALLRIVTRWLLMLSAPVYLLLLYSPELVLSIYDDEFAVSARPLAILLVGQAVQTICAPAMRLIPMSGHALLNFFNGLGALALNGLLLWLWIPAHGAVGAAMATATTLVAWSLWRLAEVGWMMRILPFDRRSLGLLALALGLGVLSLLPFPGLWRPAAGVVAALGYSGLALVWGRAPEDEALIGRVSAKLRTRLRGSRGPGAAG
jgi:O-antigen/teichoic acid export membrane protein